MIATPTATGLRKTALITGASSGIGYQFGLIFARHGYDCVLVARSRAKLEALAERLKREHGVDARVLVKDLAQPNASAEINNELAAARVAVDVLVNNAGFSVYGPFTQTRWSDEMEMLQVNIVALTQLTKLLLPRMLERRSGRILNVASTAGLVPGPLMALYYASKAYVISFSEAVANELSGTGVSVTTLCPGPTRTGLVERAGMQQARLFRSGVMDAQAVAEAGYRGLMAGKAVVLPGLRNKVLPVVVRLSPRSVVTRVVRWTNDTAP